MATPLCGLGLPLSHCWEHILVYNLYSLTSWPQSKAILPAELTTFYYFHCHLWWPFVVLPWITSSLLSPTNHEGITHDELLFARLKNFAHWKYIYILIHYWYLFSLPCRQRSKPITHDQFLKHKFGKYR